MKTLIILLFLCPCYAAFAQSDSTGIISGMVINTQEDFVANTRIAVYRKDSMVAFIKGNPNGQFTSMAIAPGLYNVHIVARGYKRSVVTKVPVKVNSNTGVHVKIFERKHRGDTIYVYSTYELPIKKTQP